MPKNKKKSLLEVDYEQIFSPRTIQALKGKSAQSLRQMLGDKNLQQTLIQSKQILQQIIQAEADYKDELEMVAVQLVTDAYPVIDYANIKIEAHIGFEDVGSIPPPSNEPPTPNHDTPEAMLAKRRIINGVTQGAAIRGSFAFMLFREYIDAINPELVEKYSEILKMVFGTYDDENAIAMMLALLAQGTKFDAGNEEEVEWDEENEQFVIKAQAACFPMLVHEIVKGLYEIIGTEGFGTDKEQNQAIVNQVDKTNNEPHDLQYGKFIYDELNNLYIESGIDDPRVRELFLAEVYKLGEEEFIPFIENLINGELTRDKKQWALNTMRDIERDLRKDDSGLDGLD
jgi:hypothetical protein